MGPFSVYGNLGRPMYIAPLLTLFSTCPERFAELKVFHADRLRTALLSEFPASAKFRPHMLFYPLSQAVCLSSPIGFELDSKHGLGLENLGLETFRTGAGWFAHQLLQKLEKSPELLVRCGEQ
jgi:hypothetical protein